MSHEPPSESRDPLVEQGPAEPLPQDEFPEYPLSAVVEPCADGSRRCIFYPKDQDDAHAESRWLAADHDLLVSVAQWR